MVKERVLDYKNGTGLFTLTHRQDSKRVSVIVDQKGNPHSVKFADWDYVPGLGSVVLYYRLEENVIKSVLAAHEEALGPSVNINRDDVFNVHTEAIRRVRYVIEKNNRQKINNGR